MSYTTTDLPFIQTSITSFAKYVLDESNGYKIVLTYPSQFEFNSTMTGILQIDSPINIGTNTLKVILPDTVNASKGYNARIINVGSHSINIYQPTEQLLITVTAGQFVDVYLGEEIWEYTLSGSGYTPSDVTASDLVGPGLSLYPYLLGSSIRLAANCPVLEINENIYYLEQQNRAFTLINKIPETTFYVNINFDIGYYFSIYNETETNCYVQDPNSGQIPFVVAPKQCVTFKKIRDDDAEPILEKRWLLEYNTKDQIIPPKFLLVDVKNQFNQFILPDTIFTANILDIVNNQSNNLTLLIPDPYIGGWVVINNASDRFTLNIALQNNPNQTVLLPYGSPTEIISDGQKLYTVDQNTVNLSKGALFVGDSDDLPSELLPPTKIAFVISDDRSNTRFSSTPQPTEPLIEHSEEFSVINSFVQDVDLTTEVNQHELWAYFDCTDLNTMIPLNMEDVKNAGYTGCIWGWGKLIITQIDSNTVTTEVGFISTLADDPTLEYDTCIARMQEAKNIGIEKHILSFGGPYNTYQIINLSNTVFLKDNIDVNKIIDYVRDNGFTGYNIDYVVNSNTTGMKLSALLNGSHEIMYGAYDPDRNWLPVHTTSTSSNSGALVSCVGMENELGDLNKRFNAGLVMGGDYNVVVNHVVLSNNLGQQNSNYINQNYYGGGSYTNWTVLTDVQYKYGSQKISLMLPVGAAGSLYAKSPSFDLETGAFSPYYPHYNGNGFPTNSPDSCGTVLTIEQMLKIGLTDSYGTAKPMFDVLKDIKHDPKFNGITAYLANIDFNPSQYSASPSWSGSFPTETPGQFGRLCKQFLHLHVGTEKFAQPVIKQDIFEYKNDVLESVNLNLRISLSTFPERYPENLDCNLYFGVSYLKEFNEEAMIFTHLLQENFISHLIHNGNKYEFNLVNRNIIFDTANEIIEPCTFWVYFAYDQNQSSITNGVLDFYWNNFTDVQLYNVTISSYLEPYILEPETIFKGGDQQTVALVQPPKQVAIFCSDQFGNVGWTKTADIKYNVDHYQNVGTYTNGGVSTVTNTSYFYSPHAYYVVNGFPNNYLSEILFDLNIKINSTTTGKKNCNLYIGLEPKTSSIITFDYTKLVYKEMIIPNIVGTSPITIQEKFSILNAVSSLKEPCIIWLYFGIDEIQRQEPSYSLTINCNISSYPFIDLMIYSTVLYLPNLHLERGATFYVNSSRKIKQAKIGINELVAGVGTDEIGAIAANSRPEGILLTENYKPVWQSQGISDPYIDHENIVDILEINNFTPENAYLVPFSNNSFVPRLWQGRRKTSVFFPLKKSYAPFFLTVPSNSNPNNFINIKGMVPKKKWQVPVFKTGSDNSMEFQFGIGMCNTSSFHVDKNTGWNSNETEALGRIDNPENESSFYFVPCSEILVLDGTYDSKGNEPQDDMYFDISFRATPDFHIPWEAGRALFFCFYPIKEGSSWNDKTIWSCSQGSSMVYIESMNYYPYVDSTMADLFTTGAIWAIDEEKKLYPILGGAEGDILTKENGFPVWTSFQTLENKILNSLLNKLEVKK